MPTKNVESTSNAGYCGFVIYAILLAMVHLTQGSVLNYFYLANIFKDFKVYFFFVSDFICLIIFIFTLVMAYKNTNNNQKRSNNSNKNQPAPDSWYVGLLAALRLIYIAWATYVTVIIVKVVIIFKQILNNDEKYEFESQLLGVIVGLSSLVFWSLVECSYWNRNIELLAINKRTAIEIFDAAEMLYLLIKDTNITGILETVMLALACSNFVYPLLCLYELNEANGGVHSKKTAGVEIVHNAIRLLLVDIPFVIVRMYLWLVFQEDLSMFMMKNWFNIILGLYQLSMDLKSRYFSASDDNAEIPLTDAASKIVHKQIYASSNLP